MIDWYRLIRPKFWSQNYPTNISWDKTLNGLIDMAKAGQLDYQIGPCVLKIGENSIWIENWPNAYGRPHESGDFDYLMPKAKTRVRLRRFVNDEPYSMYEKYKHKKEQRRRYDENFQKMLQDARYLALNGSPRPKD